MKGFNMRLTFAVVATLLSILTPTSASATMIGGGYFTGEVSSINDPLGKFADTLIGDSVTGYFRYSLSPSDYNDTSGYLNDNNNPFTNPDTNTWDLLVSVTTATRTITNKDNESLPSIVSTQIRDESPGSPRADTFAISAYHGNIFAATPLVTEAILNFNDLGGMLFDGPTGLSNIIFDNADQRVGQLSFLADTTGDGNREARSNIFFNIQSLAPISVPEPSALALFILGIVGLCLARKSRKW